jgi:hypothetical protein
MRICILKYKKKKKIEERWGFNCKSARREREEKERERVSK